MFVSLSINYIYCYSNAKYTLAICVDIARMRMTKWSIYTFLLTSIFILVGIDFARI